MVPGHEIVGKVVEVGSEVKNFAAGDRVGVGCMVGSCHHCDSCSKGQEQYCEKVIWTYGSTDVDGSVTFGGYSSLMVCNQSFVVKIPESLPFDAAAPLLCAGITVYSPMKYFQMTEPGMSLGVVGLGGLGHMAVKFGKAFGLQVTVISTSPNKEKEAKEVLGADHFLISKDEKQMQAAAKSLDYIIDTVAANHPLEPLLSLLKVNGKLVIVGLPEKPVQFAATSVVMGRRFVGGSLIGGVKETQEMLDFCGEHNISCMIEKISMDYVNTAMERLVKSDVKYRFVIDSAQSFKSEGRSDE
jgi:cinnamyl-alcohol dehydrogenase